MNDPLEEKTKVCWCAIGSLFLVVMLKDSFVLDVKDDYGILQAGIHLARHKTAL